MGSPAGFSSLLTSTDMSPLCSSLSSWWLQSFARLKPRQKPLLTLTTDTTDTTDSSMDTVTLVTPITDTAISGTMDTGSTTMARERLMPSHTMAMDTMVMVMDTTAMVMDMVTMVTITMVRGRLTPSPTTGTDTMAIMAIMDTMDTDTTDMDIMDIMDIMDTSMDNELRVENSAEIVVFYIQPWV